MIETEKIVRVEQCLHNSWKQSIYGSQVASEFLVLTIDWHLLKFRFTLHGKYKDEGKFEQVMSLDLAKFPRITELLQGVTDYENVTLTEKTISYKNQVFSLEQGEFYDLTNEEEAKVDFSESVRASIKTLIGTRKDNTLEISTIDNPSSRSSNPLGFNYLGLRNIMHFIPIGPNYFLL